MTNFTLPRPSDPSLLAFTEPGWSKLWDRIGAWMPLAGAGLAAAVGLPWFVWAALLAGAFCWIWAVPRFASASAPEWQQCIWLLIGAMLAWFAGTVAIAGNWGFWAGSGAGVWLAVAAWIRWMGWKAWKASWTQWALIALLTTGVVVSIEPSSGMPLAVHMVATIPCQAEFPGHTPDVLLVAQRQESRARQPNGAGGRRWM